MCKPTFKQGSVGKPMLLNEVKIVDNNGKEVTVHQVGELIIRGGHTFEFYWNNKQATNETIRGGWVYTGDLAKQDEQGNVSIVGRKKEMIITGGENVYPSEVEQVLEAHSEVSAAAVIGIPDEKWGEAVTAYVTVNRALSVDELINWCYQHLSRYKVPKQILIVDKLPVTSVGKIDKEALKGWIIPS